MPGCPVRLAESPVTRDDACQAFQPYKPVKYVIYSHSHVDHFGGVKGVTSPEDVRDGKVGILAPQGFMEAAVAENIMAGTAMKRRAARDAGRRGRGYGADHDGGHARGHGPVRETPQP